MDAVYVALAAIAICIGGTFVFLGLRNVARGESVIKNAASIHMGSASLCMGVLWASILYQALQ